MSFANYDIEAQKPVPQKSGLSTQIPENDGTAELDAIVKNTSHQIQAYGSLVATFNNERKLLGSRRDNVDLRKKLDTSQNNIKSLGSAIRKLLADINTVMGTQTAGDSEVAVSNRQHIMKDRLVSEFGELEANFGVSSSQYAEKVANTPLVPQIRVNASGLSESSPLLAQNSSADPSDPYVQIQTQEDQELIEQTELQYHIMLTEERNRQIEQVAEGIREVNSIFKDLGELVNQQGEQLDTVEENVLQMSGNAVEASRELNKAHEYQKKKSRWSCIMLVALCVFVLIMVLLVIS